MLGALLGGLRCLLQAADTKHPTNLLDDGIRQRLTVELKRRPNLARTSGLARVLFVSAAAVSSANILQDFGSSSTRVLIAVIATLSAGLLLEGVPSLVLRNRGRYLVLLSLPLARLCDWLMCPITLLIEKTLRALDAEVVAGEETLSESEQRMIGRVFELGESDVAKAMTPRTELTAVQGSATLLECLEIMNQAGHSRIPVFGENLDDILGIAYLKDIVSMTADGNELGDCIVKDNLRNSYFIPETKSVSELLEEMRSKRVHLAVAVDEYGGTAGVISIEDILEEIVGEIQDEHDDQEEQAQVVHVNSQTTIVEGKMPLSDLNELLECHLPHHEDYDTIAGLLFDRLGHIPTRGEILTLNNISMRVLEADERRILKIEIKFDADDAE
jgi:putative hemolysin